jgi:diadenosine tetraphosphate (Ap4A) HIT family hydrolase
MPWHDSRKQACRENPLSDFHLDERIVRDSDLLTKIGLCELRLMKDGRWPWLMLVPQRPDVSEIFDLTPLDQTMLTFETTLVAETLKKVTGAEKINVAAIGNIVRQLHVHVIARSEGDPNWPGPVWGFGTAEPRSADETKALVAKILDALTP